MGSASNLSSFRFSIKSSLFWWDAPAITLFFATSLVIISRRRYTTARMQWAALSRRVPYHGSFADHWGCICIFNQNPTKHDQAKANKYHSFRHCQYYRTYVKEIKQYYKWLRKNSLVFHKNSLKFI